MNANIVKQILYGMITSDEFLGRVHEKLDSEILGSKYASFIADWCTRYYKKYTHAPKKTIRSVFESESLKHDEDTMELVRDLIDGLGNEFESDGINIDYLVDTADREIRKSKLSILSESIDVLLESDEIEKAEGELFQYDGAGVAKTMGVDPLNDDDLLRDVFENVQEPVLQMPGAMGEMLDPYLVRDSFVAFLAPEKRGKSWAMLECVYRGLLQGKNVAYFEAGDMSQHQVLRRMLVRMSGRPMYKRDCGNILIPKRITTVKDGFYDIEHKEVEVDKPLELASGIKAKERFLKRIQAKNKTRLKLSNHPNSTLSVADIKNQLDFWERSEGFVPDIVVLDYADILALPGKEDHRIKIGNTWKELRQLSQRRHVCLITATQADTAGYKQKWLSMENFSESKEKIAHVTCMVGLNQTDTEKENQVMRLNFVALREGGYSQGKGVVLAQNLSIGRFVCASCWV